MKSFIPKQKDLQGKNWYVVDATDMVLGRLASEIAAVLRGKHKPQFTPNMDMGDYVIVVNAEKIKLTGKKLDQKNYVYHTGYPGGQKKVAYSDLIQTNPVKIIELAVKGMLPHNRLGRQMIKKLRVYAGPEHGHEAQQPQELKFDI